MGDVTIGVGLGIFWPSLSGSQRAMVWKLRYNPNL